MEAAMKILESTEDVRWEYDAEADVLYVSVGTPPGHGSGYWRRSGGPLRRGQRACGCHANWGEIQTPAKPRRVIAHLNWRGFWKLPTKTRR